MTRVIVTKLLKDEQLEFCKLLIKCGYTVKLTSATVKGKKATAVDFTEEEEDGER